MRGCLDVARHQSGNLVLDGQNRRLMVQQRLSEADFLQMPRLRPLQQEGQTAEKEVIVKFTVGLAGHVCDVTCNSPLKQQRRRTRPC
ncbi:hypothetical protein [Roseibium salinum]|uniref:Uncharacterized protein n=1 Tax=Roseibium salinum TaxID=1604349 RepID=A0ABT3R1E8_9HYPH|nr:hypothetical protein [Roseibium sp. DSM 29163]MCX2723043.1 hypothetical protein [Roseibium sp. DSM 29163]MDN3719018.1 hypothetical protein [Roseibium salinum]